MGPTSTSGETPVAVMPNASAENATSVVQAPVESTAPMAQPSADQVGSQMPSESNAVTPPVLSSEQPTIPPIGVETVNQSVAPSSDSNSSAVGSSAEVASTGFASSESAAAASPDVQAPPTVSIVSDAIPQSAVVSNVNAADQHVSGAAADFAPQPGDMWKERVETKEKGRLSKIMAAINPFHKNEPAASAVEPSTKAPEQVPGAAADFAPAVASAETPSPPAASPEPPQPQIPSQPTEMPGYVTDGAPYPPMPADTPELNPLQSESSAAPASTQPTPIAPAPDGSQILKPADSGGSTESGAPTSAAPLADAMRGVSAQFGQTPETNLQQPTGPAATGGSLENTPPATPIIDANLGIPNPPAQESAVSASEPLAPEVSSQTNAVLTPDQTGGSQSNVVSTETPSISLGNAKEKETVAAHLDVLKNQVAGIHQTVSNIENAINQQPIQESVPTASAPAGNNEDLALNS